MPSKDAARTSVLSKTWQRAWISLPMCDFSCVQFCLSRQQYETKEFVNRVDEALSNTQGEEGTRQRIQVENGSS